MPLYLRLGAHVSAGLVLLAGCHLALGLDDTAFEESATSGSGAASGSGSGGDGQGGGATGGGATTSGGGDGGTSTGSGGSPPVEIWYVDPATGDDGNPGSEAAPFQTIAHALTVAQADHEVALLPGTYDASSGETWSYAVPAGVRIVGKAAGVVLAGEVSSGFEVDGDFTLRALTVEGFDPAVEIASGTVTLDQITFVSNDTSVRVDGGVVGFSDCEVSGGAPALDVRGGAANLTAGTIAGTGPSCSTGHAVKASGAATVSLTGTAISTAAGAAVHLADTAAATVDGVTITGAGQSDGIGPCADAIEMTGETDLIMTDTRISSAAAVGVRAVGSGGKPTVSIGGDSRITSMAGGVHVQGGTLSFTNSRVEACNPSGFGIWVDNFSTVTVTDALLKSCADGVRVEPSALDLTMRGTELDGVGAGVRLFRALSASAKVDLGTSAQPGDNLFSNAQPAIVCEWNGGSVVVDSIGNKYKTGAVCVTGTGDYNCASEFCPCTPMQGPELANPTIVLQTAACRVRLAP